MSRTIGLNFFLRDLRWSGGPEPFAVEKANSIWTFLNFGQALCAINASNLAYDLIEMLTFLLFLIHSFKKRAAGLKVCKRLMSIARILYATDYCSSASSMFAYCCRREILSSSE